MVYLLPPAPHSVASDSFPGPIMYAVVCTVLALALLSYSKNTKARCKGRADRCTARLPPGPAGLPVIGNLNHMVWNKPVFRWIHRLLQEMNTNILCLRLGAVHVVVVSSPEIARDEILRKNNDAVLASRPITFASGSFSYGYKITSMSPYGEQWKKMRRVLSSEILSTSMEGLLQCRRAEEAGHLVRFVYSQCSSTAAANNNSLVNVRHLAQHFCGNTIRTLMFGKRHFAAAGDEALPVSILAGPDEETHVRALFTLLNSIYSFSVLDCIPAWIGLDLDGHKVVKGVMKTLSRFHDPIIHDRIHDYWSSLGKRGDDKRETTTCRDFLDVLVSLRDPEGQPFLWLDEIRAQTAEIMLASVDNPSNAVEWALAEMMNKQEVMQQAIDELDTIVGKERLVQESDIPRLNYLKACIREAFRLHPYHAFNLPHVAMEDTTVSGYLVPKGSHVLLSRVSLGRNSDTWDAPLEFRPELHLMNDKSDVLLAEPDLRFISFGTGRRGCPAVSLGTSITMMLFARLVHGFTWNKPPGVHTIELNLGCHCISMRSDLFSQPCLSKTVSCSFLK